MELSEFFQVTATIEKLFSYVERFQALSKKQTQRDKLGGIDSLLED